MISPGFRGTTRDPQKTAIVANHTKSQVGESEPKTPCNSKRKAGRPTKLTPALANKIVALVRNGNFRETACAAAGIGSQTLRDWLKMGARGREPYKTFSFELDEAEATAEALGVGAILSQAKKDFRAATWWLEHRFQERWGGKQRVELTGHDGGPVQIADTNLNSLSNEQLRRIAAGLPIDDEGESSPDIAK